MIKTIYTTLCFLVVPMCFWGQTVNVSYLNPTHGNGDPYKFVRFGTSSDYQAGFMWNNTAANFGDGDDFSIFTYGNRDMTFNTGTGNFIVFPSSGGNVGIGTKNPVSKLQVNGDFYLYSNDAYDTGWGKTHFYWRRHSLIMGSPVGTYSHNTIELKPGGSTRGELFSSLQLFQALGENNHEERIKITSSKSHPTYFNAGKVGIGTNNPSTVLDVNGKTTVNSIKIDGYNQVSSVNGYQNKIEFTGGGHGAIVFKPGDAKELMFGFHDNGNFYWGTGRSATTPNYYAMYLNGSKGHLGVKGKITSSEVKVKIGGWADYVFEETYELPTLSEVEKHIKEKGHLQNIPSAKEVAKNGIQLGEMNMKLLEKIEELTLYTIAQEKEIQTLKAVQKQNTTLEERVENLEKIIANLLNTQTNEK